MKETKISKIKKRDGRIVDFDQNKIVEAIFKAAQSVGGEDRSIAERLSDQVVELLEKQSKPEEIPTVEQVQDIVEKVLIDNGHAKTAKAYILYRQKRAEVRKIKSALGVVDELKLPLNSIVVLASRYLRKDENGRIVESTKQLFERVAKAIAEIDKLHGKSKEDVEKTEKEFYDMITNFEFTPNSPTLMNAGTGLGQLSACFTLPVPDSIEGIFDAVKYTALIHQTGGGTGFSFSKLRPRGDMVKSTSGVASGPVSFMKVFDAATEEIKQGGKRRGANMGILRVDHPDILDFIVVKEKEGILSNFNISVAVTDKFMKAVEKDDYYDLVNPRNGKIVNRLKARAVWNLIVTMAWKTGDPGVVFIDNINRTASNPVPSLGPVESTNPCGEQPLYPYDSCNLGSINLSKMVKPSDGEYQIDWDKIRETVRKAVHFLDNVIDANKYTIPQIEEMTKKVRRIGLGVMGFADMLIQLGIPYNSNAALKTAESVMKFITDEARKVSVELGKERGSFPEFKNSIWHGKYEAMRTSTVTTIAPTGTISIITGGCSQGIEPLFAVVYMRNVGESLGSSLIEVNNLFETIAIKEGFYSEELIEKISRSTSLQHIEEIPEHIRRLFITAHDINPEWHVRMQASFQKYTDNAVSKTINFKNEATPSDVETAYMLAYQLGCKGITIYRDKSKSVQVLTAVGETGPVAYQPKCETCDF
jgi:ribonucleoside-diphosphate reductase alpha chain